MRIAKLPKGFKQVEYIESSGEQYIDTGFKPNNNTRAVCDIQCLENPTSWKSLFGARDSAQNVNIYGLWISSQSLYATYYGAAQNEKFSSAISATARHLVDKNKNITTIDYETITLAEQSFQVNYSVCLFVTNTGGTVITSEISKARLYACQIYDNGTLVRDFVPCITDAGEVGLYDDLNGVFYGNAGTGTFAAGPVIYEGLPAPANLNAEITETGVFLLWDAVETSVGYRVYRDDWLIAEITENEYTDNYTQNWSSYEYSVSAFNETEEGAAASVFVTLTGDNPIPDLITDRTAADVSRVVELSKKDFLLEMTDQERREFLGSMKGAYNTSDLNRVGAAIEYLTNRLNGYGANVKVSPKTDWLTADVPTAEQLAEYLAGVAAIRGALSVMQSTPAVPGDMEGFTFDEANNIEQILLDVDLLITNMSLAWFYCGEIYSGEV